MKKSILILIIILVVLGLVYIVGILIYSGGNLFYNSEALEKTINEAISTNNPSLCEKLPTAIADTQPRSQCYIRTSIGLKDTSLCKKFVPQPYYCILSIAVAKKDIIICEELSSNQQIGQCQTKVAMETLDFTICDQIKDISWRDSCFGEKSYNENNSLK